MNSNSNVRAAKNEKIRFRGECLVSSANSSESYVAEIHEISQEDMVFSLKSAIFSSRSLVEIKLRSDSKANVTLLAIVQGVPELHQGSCYQYSIKFEHRLNERRFKDIVVAFRPNAFDVWS